MTSSLTPLLKPIRERLEKITPWPWHQSKKDYYRVEQSLYREDVPPDGHIYIAEACGSYAIAGKDAEFIAHAPETIAKLLKCVERMEQLVCVGEEGLDCMVCRMKKDVRAILEEGK